MKKIVMLLLLCIIMFNFVLQPISLLHAESSSQSSQKDTVEIGKTDLILILLALIIIILIL